MDESDLEEVGRLGVEAALREGADQAEAYGSISRSVRVWIDSSRVQYVRVIYDSGLGIRSYIDGGLGFSYITRLDKRLVEEAARKASKLARVAGKDPAFKSLPEPEEPRHVRGLYDEALASIEAGEAVSIAQEMIKAALEISEDIIISGRLTISSSEYMISNSLGINHLGMDTSAYASAMCIIKRSADDVGAGAEFDASRSLKGLDAEWVARKAAENSMRFLGARLMKTKVCTFLLSPNATMGLIYGLSDPLGGYAIILDRSCLAGKVGSKIASEILSLVDDGTVEGGVASSEVDGEGVPKRRFTVIEDGILKTYFHNSYTAIRTGMENNACAARASFRSPLTTAPSNLQVKRGDQSLEEIIGEIKDGIYVDSFPRADPVTGNISAMIDFGIHIKNGEFAEPIKGTMIGSNLLDILRDIDAVSREVRDLDGIVMPYMRIRNVQIAGI